MNYLLSLLLGSCLLGGTLCHAEEVYMNPSDFLKSNLGGVPAQKALNLTSEHQAMIKKLIGRKYQGSRVRYWQQGSETCFILDEIGKVKPITTGFCIEGGKIKEMRVLIYRESHGWEVEKSFFRKQFKGVTLQGTRLSKAPSNIAGATLSVNALTKLGRLALYLASQV